MNYIDIFEKLNERKEIPCNLPDIILEINDANEKYYYNLMTGIKYENKTSVMIECENFKIYSAYNIYIYRDDLYYDEKLNCLVIDSFKINLNTPKIGEKRNWEFVNFHFITKDKKYIGNVYGDKVGVCHFDGLKGVEVKLPQYYTNEFHKMFPVASLSGNNFFILSQSWEFKDFIDYKEPIKKDGPKQRKIDELVSIKLPKTKNNTFRRTPRYTSFKSIISTNKFCKIDRVNEQFAVIRFFVANPEATIVSEYSRIYVDDKNYYCCRKNAFNEWIFMSSALTQTHFESDYFLRYRKNVLDGTRLQYYSKIIPELDTDLKSKILWSFLVYPNTEKIYKSSLKPIIINALESQYFKITEHFKLFFNIDIKKDINNIYAAFGINKYQAQKIGDFLNSTYSKNRYNSSEIIKYTKIAFNDKNLAPYDNESFDKVFDALVNFYNENLSSFTKNIAKILNKITKIYSFKTMVSMSEKICKSFSKIGTYVIISYSDYLDMVDAMDDTKHFRPNFEELEDIIIMHDAAMAVYNLKKDTYKNKSFQKNSVKLEKYKFENEKFIIVIPSRPGELAIEGITLHHCVRLYIDKVCEGITNIVFIRKKENPNTPFFTVEISNEGNIEQVHGNNNCNASTEPELTTFIKDWAKKCKLEYTDFNKVR